MCEICPASCQECGIEVCFDIDRRDDFIAPAYVTGGGDLYCSRCGREIDEEEEDSYNKFDYDQRDV